MRVYYVGHAASLGFWGFGLGWLLTLLFWILIIGLLVALFEGAFGSSGRTSPDQPSTPKRSTDQALAILRERYARGDISQDQFSRMRQDLDNN
jgi:putative membrane protein